MNRRKNRPQKEVSRERAALITGITGQDGSYLAEFLLKKGYRVYGLMRRSSSFNTGRINHLYQDPHDPNPRLQLVYGDLNDASSLNKILRSIQPDEIYNLGAQSHVRVSFDIPEYTTEITGVGTLRLLEAIRDSGIQTRFYQASSSEMFGKVQAIPQNEQTPFYPRSPYGVAKVYAYWITVNYREAYNLFACNGILFNHESPTRGETFVTRKITRALTRMSVGLQDCLYMGNINALRDWGHARDYVEMQWLMLQQDQPEDFVIATGQQHSVRQFIETAAENLGFSITWKGTAENETGIVSNINNKDITGFKNEDIIIRVDPRYYRPTEVESLLGDPTRAREQLGWVPKTSFDELVAEMVSEDLKLAQRDAMIRESGYKAFNYHE